MEGIVIMSVGGPLPPGLEHLHDLLDPDRRAEHMREHVEECRKGDYDGALCLVSTVRGGLVSLEEVGVTEEDLERIRQVIVDEAKGYVEECREGNLEHFDQLVDLWRSDIVTEKDLDITEDDLQGFHQQNNVRRAKVIIEECRDGNYDGLATVLHAIDKKVLTLAEMETTEQELGEFLFKRRMGPAFSGNGTSPTSDRKPAEQGS